MIMLPNRSQIGIPYISGNSFYLDRGFRCILSPPYLNRRYGIMLGMGKTNEAAFKSKVALKAIKGEKAIL
jgi:hypothetical protein